MASPSQSGPHTVTIHGTVRNLAMGDRAVAGGGSDGESRRPFLTPPPPPQGILGRDDALTEVFELLQLENGEATEVAPVALRGLGGVGKTTMAIAIGRLETVAEQFPDGVLWAALGPDPTIRVLLEGWGRALGVDLLPERDEKACTERLRGALYERRVMIIVDDVWEAAHGQHFLVAGPRCRTLFTTRETPAAYALATRRRTLRVDILSPDASLQLLERLAPEAVALDRQGAMRLCERMEFLPLGLTLAGRFLATEADVPRRMKRLLDELNERRDARLRMLQAEGRLGITEDEPVSLQAILGLSVDRLEPVDRERFAMLAVFGGDPLTWDVEAAADVWECTVEEAEATVARLIQRGLVELRGEEYWMHALLADYATELLEDTA